MAQRPPAPRPQFKTTEEPGDFGPPPPLEPYTPVPKSQQPPKKEERYEEEYIDDDDEEEDEDEDEDEDDTDDTDDDEDTEYTSESSDDDEGRIRREGMPKIPEICVVCSRRAMFPCPLCSEVTYCSDKCCKGHLKAHKCLCDIIVVMKRDGKKALTQQQRERIEIPKRTQEEAEEFVDQFSLDPNDFEDIDSDVEDDNVGVLGIHPRRVKRWNEYVRRMRGKPEYYNWKPSEDDQRRWLSWYRGGRSGPEPMPRVVPVQPEPYPSGRPTTYPPSVPPPQQPLPSGRPEYPPSTWPPQPPPQIQPTRPQPGGYQPPPPPMVPITPQPRYEQPPAYVPKEQPQYDETRAWETYRRAMSPYFSASGLTDRSVKPAWTNWWRWNDEAWTLSNSLHPNKISQNRPPRPPPSGAYGQRSATTPYPSGGREQYTRPSTLTFGDAERGSRLPEKPPRGGYYESGPPQYRDVKEDLGEDVDETVAIDARSRGGSRRSRRPGSPRSGRPGSRSRSRSRSARRRRRRRAWRRGHRRLPYGWRGRRLPLRWRRRLPRWRRDLLYELAMLGILSLDTIGGRVYWRDYGWKPYYWLPLEYRIRDDYL